MGGHLSGCRLRRSRLVRGHLSGCSLKR
ncbi:MAG: hypothetical protein HFH92_00445 [Lachnospiraceae bacterium]|nr:hypothetical protein [Lachnospiraceae bacterium]